MFKNLGEEITNVPKPWSKRKKKKKKKEKK